MTEKETALVLGGLLCRIGRLLERGQGKGAEFLRQEAGVREEAVLDCLRLCETGDPEKLGLAADSPAYVVWIAEQTVLGADQRGQESREAAEEDWYAPLQPVFNVLNRNQGQLYYLPGTLERESDVRFPTETKKRYTREQFADMAGAAAAYIKGMDGSLESVNGLLEVMESQLSYVPAFPGGSPDISLFDHARLTAAAASCIQAWAEEAQITDYRKVFFENCKACSANKLFLLASLDTSGIQNFIYTITTKHVLRSLRARSFYLEIMMEHLLDELLEKLDLSRANRIYSGGGHCYLLLPNTRRCRQAFDQFLAETNQWMLEQFQTDLYTAGAYEPCSPDDLRNRPEGSYEQMFWNLSAKLSARKRNRYTPEQILWLNRRENRDYTRECAVCRRIGTVNQNGVCPVCQALEDFSRGVLYEDYFTVVRGGSQGLPLPGGCSLTADSRRSLQARMADADGGYVRAYGKNRMDTELRGVRKFWTGSYTSGSSFAEFAEAAEGVRRVGILRADVDSLGQAFASGFKNPDNKDRYVTLSRTAALSWQLSLFFKFYINRILEHGTYSMKPGRTPEPRRAAVVYSGGDDLFAAGAWNEVLELAVDIRREFERFTEGALTLSAGIGIYHSRYPVSTMAGETEELEDASKRLPGKNAVTLLEDGESHTVTAEDEIYRVSDGTWKWQELEEGVLGEKLSCIAAFLDTSPDRGNAFLSHLLEGVQNQKERIQFARFVYLLARMEPDGRAEPEARKAYRAFSGHMLRWVQREEDRRQLKTAMMLYLYRNRTSGEEENDADH